jgi:hypothetical protein
MRVFRSGPVSPFFGDCHIARTVGAASAAPILRSASNSALYCVFGDG